MARWREHPRMARPLSAPWDKALVGESGGLYAHLPLSRLDIQRRGTMHPLSGTPQSETTATAHAKVYHVQQKYDWVWVCPGNPTQDVPPFAQWDDPSFRKIHCGPYRFHASGPRAVENFLDVTHFPFVHQGYLGDPAHPEINDYEAEIRPDGVTARDITIWQPDPDGSGKGATVTYTYDVVRCLTAFFMKSSSGPRFAMYFTVTPVSERKSIAWTYVAQDYDNIPEAEIRAFEDMITWQDVPIVESQRPELLPLDLQAELHLRSDRTAIAYRKWLRQPGFGFGIIAARHEKSIPDLKQEIPAIRRYIGTTDARKGPPTSPPSPVPTMSVCPHVTVIVGTGDGWGWSGPLRASVLLVCADGWNIIRLRCRVRPS